MRRTDTEFKAEIFRRYNIHKKQRKKAYLTAGSTLAALGLCLSLALPPMIAHFSAEEPPIKTESTMSSFSELPTYLQEQGEYSHIKLTFGEKTWTFSGEKAEKVLTYLQEKKNVPDKEQPEITITTEATTTDKITDTEEDGNYLLIAYYQTDTYTVTAAEPASNRDNQTEAEKSKTYLLTETYWDFEKLEAFLNELENDNS